MRKERGSSGHFDPFPDSGAGLGLPQRAQFQGQIPEGGTGMQHGGEQSRAWPPPSAPPGFAASIPYTGQSRAFPWNSQHGYLAPGFSLRSWKLSPHSMARQAGKCCRKQELRPDPALLSLFPELFLRCFLPGRAGDADLSREIPGMLRNTSRMA